MARKQKDLEEKYYNMEEKGIDFVPYFQKTYPKRLSELDGAPYALYVKGKLGNVWHQPGYRLSVVLHLVLTGPDNGVR